MNNGEPKRPLRVAIACPGVGLVQRGYERMIDDLYRLLEGELDVTLFMGGGATGERKKIPVFLPRNGRFLRMFPIHRVVGRTTIHAECMTFALGMLPYLREGRFDVVHCIDPPLARILYKLRRLGGMRFRLLFTHACSMPPSNYPPVDHVQEVAQVTYDQALQGGLDPRAMTLLPVGMYPEYFEVAKSKEELRREYRVPAQTFLILSVAAINRNQKRIDYLIDEAAKLEGDFLLWLDGSLDQGDPDLVEYARSRLGGRCRITQVPSSKVGELYRMADVMAHTAAFEAFGLSIVEAASTGLPVLVDDAPHFRWLLPNREAWVGMGAPGALAERLAFLMAHPQALAAIQCRESARQRFAWPALRDGYKAMYARVAELPEASRGKRGTNYFSQVHG
jgi:glycosyltransferase involved in cell wall biosynthesis